MWRERETKALTLACPMIQLLGMIVEQRQQQLYPMVVVSRLCFLHQLLRGFR